MVKMNKPFIALCPEITRAHALNLIEWLDDDSVVHYLSDSRHIARYIEQVVQRVNLPTLTHLFNQGGRFFMAYDRHDEPVGFVRLVPDGSDCEIVLVIGDRKNWGRRLGASAIGEGMKLAFFDMRAERLIARIHAENVRSVRAFLRCGFLPESETASMTSLAMTSEHYRRRLREGHMWDTSEIYVTEIDRTRLMDVIACQPGPSIYELVHEIERAVVVDSHQITPDVITMNSRAILHLDDGPVAVALVYPEDDAGSGDTVSICSDLGMAILGYKEGDLIHWRIANRTRQIRIEKVLYQPEAAGDFHL